MPPDAGMLSEATRSQCPMVYFREGMALTTYDILGDRPTGA